LLVGLSPDPSYPSRDSALTSPLIGQDGTVYAAIVVFLFAVAGTNGTGNAAWPHVPPEFSANRKSRKACAESAAKAKRWKFAIRAICASRPDADGANVG